MRAMRRIQTWSLDRSASGGATLSSGKKVRMVSQCRFAMLVRHPQQAEEQRGEADRAENHPGGVATHVAGLDFAKFGARAPRDGGRAVHHAIDRAFIAHAPEPVGCT